MRLCAVLLMIILPTLPLSALQWEELNVKVVESVPSDERGSTRHILNDSRGRAFEVNYQESPDTKRMTRVIELKDMILAWKDISARRIEFYFSGEGIYVNTRLEKIAYRDRDLMGHLPAGISLQDRKEGLFYRFRIVAEGNSRMLEGPYDDEESLLRRICGPSCDEDKTERHEEVKAEKTQHLSFRAAGCYLEPTRRLADVFDTGYGAVAGISLSNAGISVNDVTLFHLDITLLTGCWMFSPRPGYRDEFYVT